MTRLWRWPKALARRVIKGQASGRLHGHWIFNEAVNFDKQAIFIAVPKTGTSTVRAQLRQKGRPLIPQPHLDILQVRDGLYAYVLATSLGKGMRFPSEGNATDQDLRERARQLFETFFKFSSVRNPWARAVSLFHRREGVRPGDETSFEKFCEQHLYASDTCRHPTLHRNQLDWLVDENGRLLMDYVYRVEDFDQAIREIEERTDGRIRLRYREANKNPQSRSGSYRDVHTERTRKLIAERFEKDIDFFKYSF